MGSKAGKGNTARNKQVKDSIINAFFALLDEKRFSEISITDITSVAGVSRMSYYRNFDSKEQIVEEYLDGLCRRMIGGKANGAAAGGQDALSREVLSTEFTQSLEIAREERGRILALVNAGFSATVQKMMNGYFEERLGDMPVSSVRRFGLYFASGALFNVLVQWLAEGTREAPENLAGYCAGLLCGDSVLENE